MSQMDNDERNKGDKGVHGVVDTGCWKGGVPPLETREMLDARWFPRSERLKVWGSKFFDHDLKPLSGASNEVALEVCLIREQQEAECRARFEIRTNLALFSQGSNPTRIRLLWTAIADAQRELSAGSGVWFPEAGTARPYVLTRGSRRLVRAYGKGSIFEIQEMAVPRLRAYLFLASMWRVALLDQRDGVSIARVRRITEDVIAPDNMDMKCLFARPNEGADVANGRPELTDGLLVRTGLALGCRIRPDGRYEAFLQEIVVRNAPPPPGIVRMVAEDLAALRGLAVDTILRKTLQPMLAGELNGPIVRYTPAQAAAVRTALRKRQGDQPTDLEN